VQVKPSAADRPHWEWNREHLTELCVVSGVDVDAADAAGATEIHIVEAPGPTCPRCWRRTGEASGSRHDPNLCKRCAAVVEKMPLHNGAGVVENGGLS
jgi:hypothetical protein